MAAIPSPTAAVAHPISNDPAITATTSSQSATAATEAIYANFLCRPTAKRRLLARLYKPPHNVYQSFCDHLTVEECERARREGRGSSSSNGLDGSTSSCSSSSIAKTTRKGSCNDVHFQVTRFPQTDDTYGHCSYLSTCHRTGTCKYLHFHPVRPSNAPAYKWQCAYADWEEPQQGDDFVLSEMAVKHPPRALADDNLSDWLLSSSSLASSPGSPAFVQRTIYPPQWLNADLQTFDLTVLGKFDVIVQDTAFDIHMSLPYGTMTDDSIRAMPIQHLQDTGFIFFWVTGRAMELGRELLDHWGYTRVDELVWVKVGQTQRTVRTGRTGHWLNHTKEHCLIGAKNCTPGATSAIPPWAHTHLDSDVLVSEVRDTSRKPDELYGLIERLAPGGRKLELFGRRHNARSGWLTVGNQLKSDQLIDPELKRRVEQWREANPGK